MKCNTKFCFGHFCVWLLVGENCRYIFNISMSHPSDINRKLIIVKLLALALALTNLVLDLANLVTILAKPSLD